MPRPEGRSRILKKLPRQPGQIAREKGITGQDRDLVPDEARIGQKNKITRRWARRGTRPARLMISGPVRPISSAPSARTRARAPGWSCPPATAKRWSCIWRKSPEVAPGAHAVLLLDQAGWHLSARLVIPANITLIAAAAEIARAQSGREHLAVHARQLALKPRLQILRRYPRPLLLRLEQARRPAMDNHVHRSAPMGAPVLIKGAGITLRLRFNYLSRVSQLSVPHPTE